MTYDGGLSVKKLWRGDYDEGDGDTHPNIWDRLDAMIWVKLRIQFIFFAISIILTIVSIILSVIVLFGK